MPKVSAQVYMLDRKIWKLFRPCRNRRKRAKCDQSSVQVQHPISLIFAIHVSFIIPVPMMWILLTKPMQKSVTTVCLHCSLARLKNKHIGVLGTNVATISWLHWSPVTGYTAEACSSTCINDVYTCRVWNNCEMSLVFMVLGVKFHTLSCLCVLQHSLQPLAEPFFFGITGRTRTWISNFQSKRQQRVVELVMDGDHLQWVHVRSGIPQGTVLGPLLFLACRPYKRPHQ